MTSRELRLFAYGRFSDVRGRSGEAFIPPEDQMRRCRDYASAYDHTIIEEGLDLDVSGGVMSRPVLDRFLIEIKDGRADGLIVAKLDRFARSSRGALNALAEIESAGGVLISVQEQIDSTTTAGRFVRSIFLATAEWERERIGENWKSAKESAVSRGIHISRHVPPGYERLPRSNGSDDRKLEPHPKHGKTITKAFELAAAGDSYSSIAAYLNERSLPLAGKDGVWQPNRIRRLLANRVYLGEARSGEGVANPNAHPALVDLVTFQLAQRDRKGPTIVASAESVLAGICRCASCSFAMRSQAPRPEAVGVYRCGTTTAHGRCPAPSTISNQRLDEFVVARFLERAADRTLHSEVADVDPEILEAVTRTETSYQSALMDTELRRQIGDADHNRLIATLNDERLAALDAAASVRSDSSPGLVGSVDLAELVNELQRRKDIAGLRELLASAIDAVFIRPAASRSKTLPIENRVRIVWRDEEANLVLPKRGEWFEPRAFTW